MVKRKGNEKVKGRRGSKKKGRSVTEKNEKTSEVKTLKFC